MTDRRVIHLISGLSTGGAERDLARLAPRLRDMGYEQEVLVLGPLGPPADALRASGITVRPLADRWGGFTLPAAAATLSTRPALLVHAWLYRACALASLAAMHPGAAPVVWTILQSLTEIGRERLLHRISLGATFPLSRMASTITYNSHLARQQHEARGYPVSNGVVIPNGFDTSRFTPASDESRNAARKSMNFADSDVVIGIAARFHPLKDFPTFFAAASILAKRCPTVRFVAMGTGLMATNPDVVRLAAQVPPDNLVLCGEQRHPEANMAAWDIGTLCSVGEALPNAVGEAMACGLPVVATDVGDCARLLGDAGFIVPPADPAALASAWERLVTLGRKGRLSLGQKGRARIRADYSLAGMAESYAKIYASLIR